MKPKLPKSHRRALRFAYELMLGEHISYLPYVHGIVLRRTNRGLKLLPGYWIEPDKDPERAYLNETTFAQLTMHDYFECQQFLPGPLWLYKLTREGCAAMGWEWPLNHVRNLNGHSTPQAKYLQQQEFRKRQQYNTPWRNSHTYSHMKRQFPHRHPIYNRLHRR